MEKKEKIKEKEEKKMIAKRDHTIKQHVFFLKIKKGDDIGKLDIPSRFIEALKTEHVI